MNDEQIVAQRNASNQAAVEALQTTTEQKHYAGGNAMLGAEVEVSAEPDNPAIARLAKTRTTSNKATDNSAETKQFTTTGNYPISFEHLSEEENLSLTNDVAG